MQSNQELCRATELLNDAYDALVCLTDKLPTDDYVEAIMEEIAAFIGITAE